MVDYKKLYAYLVGQIDEALKIMDTANLLEYDHVRDLLHTALLRAEDAVINGEEGAI